MPEVSNELLLTLINNLIKKVCVIEEKLDRVLEEQQKNSADIGLNLVHRFKFTPINTEEELQRVSNRILHDEQYQRNLLKKMSRKENLKLAHLFTGDFLDGVNFPGICGKKKLETLVPYEYIYAYIKSEKGDSDEQIRRDAMTEFKKIRNREAQRHLRETRTKGTNGNKIKGDNSRMTVDHDNLSNSETFYELIDIDKAEIVVDEDSEMDTKVITKQDFDEETPSYDGSMADQHEVFIEEAPSDDQNKDQEDEDYCPFTPIDNEQQLKTVTHKIKTNPHYLKDLRLQIVEESDDGQCKLAQLFTAKFIHDYNLYGISGKKKLCSLIVYKSVYFYLNQQFGKSLQVIEKDASSEMKKMKNRFHQSLFRKRHQETTSSS